MSTLSIKLNAARSSPAWQLVLDKFPITRGNTSLLPEKKIGVLKPLANRHLKSTDWQTAILSKIAWMDSLQNQYGERFRRVKLINSSRLLLHLGRASVLENVGLYADRTTGLPVVPGSAVKGVLSTWACWAEHFNQTDGSFRDFTNTSIQRRNFSSTESRLASRIFGDNSASGSTNAGEIVFLGAFPDNAPVLELDIVTPHTDGAGHDINPIPNPFLAIAAGTSWNFAFLAKPRGQSDGSELLNQVEDWLTEALELSGMGAKTAAGYGRFLTQKKWEEATLSDTAKNELNEKIARDEEQKRRIEQFRSLGDYPNPVTFKNLVLNKLTPRALDQLEPEIIKLKKVENQAELEKLITFLRGKNMKDIRKRLKDKDWFPKEWLPQ